MAERRMFAKTIIDSDAFLDMPLSTQALYFHLSMRADDDGFINNPKKIQKMVGATDDDLTILKAKSFLIPFENGIVVIKHWKIHNYIRNDRYKETVYQEEKSMLDVKDNNAYKLKNDVGIPNGYQVSTDGIPNGYLLDTQVRLGKDRLVKDSIGESIEPSETAPAPAKEQKHKFGEYNHVRLTDKEYDKLKNDYGLDETKEAIKYLDEYIEMKGTKYTSHYMAMRKWVFDAVKEKKKKNPRNDLSNQEYDFDELEKKLLAKKRI